MFVHPVRLCCFLYVTGIVRTVTSHPLCSHFHFTSPPSAVQSLPGPPANLSTSQPANLLGMFLTFSSIVLQNTKIERCSIHARLSLVILTCITEDQFANSFLHDTNISFPVTLYRAPFLHRKVKGDKNKKSVPLACSLLDLMVEFTLSHLSKNLMLDMHR
jgi:hypothetical protein